MKNRELIKHEQPKNLEQSKGVEEEGAITVSKVDKNEVLPLDVQPKL